MKVVYAAPIQEQIYQHILNAEDAGKCISYIEITETEYELWKKDLKSKAMDVARFYDNDVKTYRVGGYPVVVNKEK